jgi:putative ABC transport system substrate-binding protein
LRRRDFIRLWGGATALWLPAARGEPPPAARRVGIILPYADTNSEYLKNVAALRDELRQRGWIEGGNLQIDIRWATDDMARVRSEAANLVQSKPDIMLAVGGRVVPVLMQLSSTIPIVVPGASDPVGVGWIQSLARPGGNVTGFTFLELSIFGKMLELLKEVAPDTRRVAMIFNPDNPSTVVFRRWFEDGARKLALEPVEIPVHGIGDFARAVAETAGHQNSAVFVPPDVTLQGSRTEVVQLITKARLAAVYADETYIRTGGLMAYAVDRRALWRRAAEYVDRILHGEKPADLPFQQPTRYQLVINVGAAKALDLRIPPSVMIAADEVIE